MFIIYLFGFNVFICAISFGSTVFLFVIILLNTLFLLIFIALRLLSVKSTLLKVHLLNEALINDSDNMVLSNEQLSKEHEIVVLANMALLKEQLLNEPDNILPRLKSTPSKLQLKNRGLDSVLAVDIKFAAILAFLKLQL